MIIFLIIGILLVGAAIGVVAHVLSPRSSKQADGVAHIERYGFRRPAQEPEQTGGRMQKGLDEMATRIGTAASGRSAAFDLAGIQRQLTAAGMYRTSPGKFLGYRLL